MKSTSNKSLSNKTIPKKTSGTKTNSSRLNQKRKKQQRSRMIQKVTRLSIVLGLFLLLIVAVWKFWGSELTGKAPTIINVAASEEITELREAGGPYGSGEAAIVQLYSVPENKTPGWQYSDEGWWYAVNKNSYYADGWAEIGGKRYHFDKEGYISTGWTPIGGTGYYFDENGVYDETRDSSHMIALTFDDGPSDFTPRLLDCLERNNARATFFMLGQMVSVYGEQTIPRMRALGCDIGNHSYDHPYMLPMSVESVATQFALCDEQIAQYNNGQGASVIRFPFGDYDEPRIAVTNRPCFFWELDTLDWDTKNVESNVDIVLNNTSPGTIILMHDIYSATVDAAEIFIPELISRGYEFVPVRELAAARGFELEDCVNYYGFSDYYVEKNRKENYPLLWAEETAEGSGEESTEE